MRKSLICVLLFSSFLLLGSCQKGTTSTSYKTDPTFTYPDTTPDKLSYLSDNWETYDTGADKGKGYQIFKDAFAKCTFYATEELVGPHPVFTFTWNDGNELGVKLGGDEKETSLIISSTFVSFTKTESNKYLLGTFSDESMYQKIQSYSTECEENKKQKSIVLF